MPKRKNLNGIPHNITQSFFGTQRYYERGYMGDWLLNAARQLNLLEASLDVLQGLFNPDELNIYPLTYHAKTLKSIIEKELLANGFDAGFISDAKIDFQFPDQELYRTTIYCFPYIIDRDGKRYESPRITADGYEPSFNPFQKINWFDKLKGSLGF